MTDSVTRVASGSSFRRPRATVLAGLILLAGIVLRLAPLAVPHAYFPDEIFQYQEAAHRLVFGPGVVPWEYRENIRSWLPPLALAGPMWLGGMLAPSSGLYLLLPKLAVLLLSLSAIAAGALLGRRISALHALFGMLVAATWVEFPLFATITLTEPVAAVTFLLGAALCGERGMPRRSSLIGGGFLLALTCVIRFQYGPAVLIFVAAALYRRPFDAGRTARELGWLFAGALPALILSALVDRTMGMMPFAWLFANIHQNITLQRSHAWVEGPFFYPEAMLAVWGIWFPAILTLAIVGARRYPALFLAAVTNLVVHSAIAHKEYRYILLTQMALILLAGIGTADAVRWARRRCSGTGPRLPALAAAGWIIAAGSAAASGPVRHWWTLRGPELSAFTQLRDTPDLCGVAIFGFDWTESGGYSYLHRAVPLFTYAAGERVQLAHDRNQFDAIVAPRNVAMPGYRVTRCWANATDSGLCVLQRQGECAAAVSPHEINRWLIRTGR